MKANWENKVNVRGYVFSTKNLKERVSSKDGSKFISGNLNIATDENALNVVTVSFYASEFYKNGNRNNTYTMLKDIIDGNVKTYEQVGKDAARVRISADIGVNDYIGQDGEMHSPKQVRGKFIHTDDYNTFEASWEADTVITSATIREYEGEEPSLLLRGFVLDYRNAMVPVNFSARDKASIEFFEGQDISPSNPCVINISGVIATNTVVRESTEETAFGARVKNTSRSFQTWEVTSGKTPLDFDDEAVITADDVKRLTTEREARLQYVKERNANRQFTQPATKVEYDF